jgi:hypothetical protein
VDGNPAYELVYLEKSTEEPEKELKYMELVTLKNNWRYGILLSAYVEDYSRHLPTFQKMIDSVNITEPMY